MKCLFGFAAAALSLAGILSAGAAEVISINFSQNDGPEVKGEAVYDNLADPNLPGDAWNNFFGGTGANQGSGSGTLAKYWDGASVQDDGTAVITYQARNFWQYGDAADGFIKSYLDDGDHDGVKGPTITVTGIPYSFYDVIVYANTDNDKAFRPVKVNGSSYTYSPGTGVSVKGTANWGHRSKDAIAYGSTALRVEGLSGDLAIQGGDNANDGRGSIAAVQIVRREAAPLYDTPSFILGPNAPGNPSGWFAEWNAGVGSNRMVGPSGAPEGALVLDGGTPKPKASFDTPQTGDLTIAAIVNLDNVKTKDDYGEYAVIYSFGKVERGSEAFALVLSKKGDALYLNNVKKTNGGSIWASPNLCVDDNGNKKNEYEQEPTNTHNGRAYCIVEGIGPGYHLIIATQSQTDNRLTLYVDGVLTVGDVPQNAKSPVGRLGRDGKGGFMLASCFDERTDGNNNGRYKHGYFRDSTGLVVDRILAWDQVLTEAQQDALWDEYKDAVKNPLAEQQSAPFYGIAGGTLVVPDYKTTSETLRFNNGTVRVTGTLDAANTVVGLADNTVNLVVAEGGAVTARAISADNADSTIEVQAGGVLEFAAFEGDGAIALSAAKSTIRAIESGDYTTGWKYSGAVSFTDLANGTTLDPNGKDIEFLSAVGGTGKVVVDATEGEGKVTFSGDLSGFTGAFSVEAGALYLPEGYSPRLDESTTEEAASDADGYKKYVHRTGEARAAKVVTESGTEYYPTVAEAVEALGADAGTITVYADCAETSFTLAAGQTLDTMGHATGAVTAAEGCFSGVVDGVYTSYPDGSDVAQTWTGRGADNKWTTAANWSLGFAPRATTPVTFNSAATVGIDANSAPNNQCASLTLNADVTLERGINNWVELFLNGDITGAGTLTLNRTCLHNATEATQLEITCPLVVTSTANDSNLRGSAGGWKISNTLTLDGLLKTENGPVDVTGSARITPNAQFQTNTALTFDGPVAIDPNATLTVQANNINVGDNASFALAPGAALVDGRKTLTEATITASGAGYALNNDNGTWRTLVSWANGDAGGNWNAAENWSSGSVPTENIVVQLNDGDKVTMDGNRYCAGVIIDGSVVIQGPGGNNELHLSHGGITGSGELTFAGAGAKKEDASTGIISEGVSVVFTTGVNNAYPWMSRGMTINGDVSIGDGMASWDARNVINGTVTFRDSTFKTTGGNNDLVFGPIHVAGDLALNKGGPKIVLNGKVSIDTNRTLTIETDDEGKVQIDAGAEFALDGVGATLVDSAGKIDAEKVKLSDRAPKTWVLDTTTDGDKKIYKVRSTIGLTVLVF